MEKMRIFRPVIAPPRPGSIRELSPFGEKLLMILQENRTRDNLSTYDNSGMSTAGRSVDGVSMQQLKRWDSDEESELTTPSVNCQSYLNPENKQTATSNGGKNVTGLDPSFISHTQNETVSNLKRNSIFADELSNKKICKRFQAPLRQSHSGCTKSIYSRTAQDVSLSASRHIACGNKSPAKRLGVMEIEMGKTFASKKTTQKKIGDFFAAGSPVTHQPAVRNEFNMINEEGTDNHQDSLSVIASQSFPSFITFADDDDDGQIKSVFSYASANLEKSRQSTTVNKNAVDVESHSSGGKLDDFLVAVDDLVHGSQDDNFVSDNDEDDNYTTDMFASYEEPEGRNKQNRFETGDDRIRNKLMRFRRIVKDE